MSSCGRGRGYLGRHHTRDDAPRPGDAALTQSAQPQSVAPVTQLATSVDNVHINGRPLETPTKPSEPRPPPTVPPTQMKEKEPSRETDDEKALAELLLVEEKYRPVVVLLEQFSTGEDGIVFNRKLKEFEAALSTLCLDDNQLLSAFSSLRGAALRDAGTARKLATVGASFTRQQRQNVLRAALLNIMQSTFAKLDVLERSNPQILTNAATLMGDYFTEARLCNGSKVHLLCPPLLQYMRSLLASNDRRAHRALATQLMQNGRELLTTNSQELDDLSIAVRRKLLTCQPTSTVWLLLSADLCINKFLPLPSSLQAFYANNLDLLETSGEQNKGYSEVTYGSWKKEDDTRSDVETERDRLEREAAQQLTIPNEDGSTRKLRPILGAGARQNTSLTESTQSSPYPSTVSQDSEQRGNKTSLAKRYDLNSWRQQENDEKNDSLDEASTSVSGEHKFIPSQQFANENYREYDGYNQDGTPQYPPKYYAPNESFSNPPPFVAPPDGKFTSPPPFVPDRSAATYGAQEKNAAEGKYSVPPFDRNQERIGGKQADNGRFPAQSLQENFPQDRATFAQERFESAGQDRTGNPGETGTFDRVAPPYTPQDRLPQGPSQERARLPQSPPENRNASENFQSGERPRRPPENWRKEKPKANWARQRSKDGEEADSESKSDDATSKGFRDCSSDSKYRRRDGRTRRKTEEGEEAPTKTPPRRHVMDVPRGKYWDHDDRLDKDYNS